MSLPYRLKNCELCGAKLGTTKFKFCSYKCSVKSHTLACQEKRKLKTIEGQNEKQSIKT